MRGKVLWENDKPGVRIVANTVLRTTEATDNYNLLHVVCTTYGSPNYEVSTVGYLPGGGVELSLLDSESSGALRSVYFMTSGENTVTYYGDDCDYFIPQRIIGYLLD